MRRRVARVVRRGLLVLGILLLLWIPVSFFAYASYAVNPSPEAAMRVSAGAGSLRLVYVSDYGGGLDGGMSFDWGAPIDWSYALRSAVGRWPEYTGAPWRKYTNIPFRLDLTVPGWLLAFICLAWPVTSFILARRRHKHGFPVEPKTRETVQG